MAQKQTESGIVIFCSDPRPENANLWKDIKRFLIPENERWVPIGFLGAPVSLAHPAYLPTDFACLMGQLEFARRKFRTEKTKIISHDCGYYERIIELVLREFTIADKMVDVSTGIALLKDRFPGDEITGHFKKPGHPGFEDIH